MKHSLTKHGLLIAALGVIVPCALQSAESPLRQTPTSASVETNRNVESHEQVPPAGPGTPVKTRVVYKPPLRGAPAVRIDGGSRGRGVSLICLNVLAPDHTGLTVQEQPSLYWFQSEPAAVPFELTLIVDKKAQPVLQVKLPDARRAGIQRLRLSDYHVTLSPGIEYEWVIALVVDPESRSKDVVASSYIQRVNPSGGLSARLAAASKADWPSIYAEEGIWYDALEALSDLIEAQPDNASWRADQAALLQQAGVTNAAAYASSLIRGN